MATIKPYETKAGTRYRVRYTTPDRRYTDRRGFKSMDEATAFAHTVEVKKLAGEYVSPKAGELLIGALGEERIAHRRAHIKPSTMHAEESTWRIHVEPRWGKTRLRDVTPAAVKTWVSELATGTTPQLKNKVGRTTVNRPLSATSIGRAHGILTGILQDAVGEGRLARNVAAGVKVPRRSETERPYLTHARVALLADSTPEPWQGDLIRALAYTGLRWGEMIGLRKKHVDLVRSRLLVTENAVTVNGRIEVGTPKTGKKRSVPMTPMVREIFAARLASRRPGDLVWGDGKTHIMPPSSQAGWMAVAVRVAQESDFDWPDGVTPHSLRHTYASLAVQAGANVKTLQRSLGHKKASMTLDTYADLFEDDLGPVADALERAMRAAID